MHAWAISTPQRAPQQPATFYAIQAVCVATRRAKLPPNDCPGAAPDDKLGAHELQELPFPALAIFGQATYLPGALCAKRPTGIIMCTTAAIESNMHQRAAAPRLPVVAIPPKHEVQR